MPTNDERREVAARLREAEIENLGFYGFSAHLGESIGECVRLVSGHYCLVEGGLNRLADLIEPEPERTCRMEPNEKGYVICSNCGEEIDAYTCDWTEPMEYSYPFCYACGAKVVE